MIDRFVELGASVLTVNGGDPFNYRWTPDLIEYAWSRGLKVHVDTNGIMLKQKHYQLLLERTILLGLPLDGPSADIHDHMRDYPGHFNIVTGHLRELKGSGHPIKVNTVVTEENWMRVGELAQVLEQYQIARWSIYEFFPMEAGERNRQRFELRDDHWDRALQAIEPKARTFTIEPGPRVERVSSTFVATHAGEVYLKPMAGPARFIGSVFDDHIIDVWRSLGQTSERDRARGRYMPPTPQLGSLDAGSSREIPRGDDLIQLL